MMRWHDLDLPPDVRYVGVARSAVLAAAGSTALQQERVQDLRTCVSEAVTNAINAHRRAGVTEPVTVRIGSEEGQVLVEVHDRGPGLPAALPLLPNEGLDGVDVDRLTIGGYGLPVMRALADQVEMLERGQGSGTIVRLRFAQSRVNDN